MGLPENVEGAMHHILNLDEEYLADVVDSEPLQVYVKPPAPEESKAPSKGFALRNAPWTASSSEKSLDMSSSEEFPSFGAQPSTTPMGPQAIMIKKQKRPRPADPNPTTHGLSQSDPVAGASVNC
ncbi:high density lipoprotein binding [Lynx pardinus]|uniref:High density lipoprotein binding n=1 Tax=Lynx pardinus TaxID=191816 RepID=A0A485MJA8_LYNPA|nr:high density lipoprotein binding [Lynx pardinus]